MNINSDAYSDIRMETVGAFEYIKYAVISREPESDATNHVMKWTKERGMTEFEIIGWDFPLLSQEQPEIFHQDEQTYIAISIKEPMKEPFRLIPNAYKTLLAHMKINGIKHKRDKKILNVLKKNI